jgi:hypothetical protein
LQILGLLVLGHSRSEADGSNGKDQIERGTARMIFQVAGKVFQEKVSECHGPQFTQWMPWSVSWKLARSKVRIACLGFRRYSLFRAKAMYAAFY